MIDKVAEKELVDTALASLYALERFYNHTFQNNKASHLFQLRATLHELTYEKKE